MGPVSITPGFFEDQWAATIDAATSVDGTLIVDRFIGDRSITPLVTWLIALLKLREFVKYSSKSASL
jgi:hypothetical protein